MGLLIYVQEKSLKKQDQKKIWGHKGNRNLIISLRSWNIIKKSNYRILTFHCYKIRVIKIKDESN